MFKKFLLLTAFISLSSFTYATDLTQIEEEIGRKVSQVLEDPKQPNFNVIRYSDIPYAESEGLTETSDAFDIYSMRTLKKFYDISFDREEGKIDREEGKIIVNFKNYSFYQFAIDVMKHLLDKALEASKYRTVYDASRILGIPRDRAVYLDEPAQLFKLYGDLTMEKYKIAPESEDGHKIYSIVEHYSSSYNEHLRANADKIR